MAANITLCGAWAGPGNGVAAIRARVSVRGSLPSSPSTKRRVLCAVRNQPLLATLT